MKQSENITIIASPERVWTALTDLEDRVRWGDRLHGMSTLDGREPAPGSRRRIGVDMSRFKVTVTAFDPPTRMVSGARNPLMSYFHAYHLTESSEGVTEPTPTGAIGEVPGSIMGAFSKNRMRRDLRDELPPSGKPPNQAPTGDTDGRPTRAAGPAKRTQTARIGVPLLAAGPSPAAAASRPSAFRLACRRRVREV